MSSASQHPLRVQLVGSANGPGENHQFLISYVIDNCVAIDAGSLGVMTPLSEQAKIRHVFLSHSHLDHVATLALFLDNIYTPGPDCVVVHGHPETLASLRSDFFNDRVWPDLIRLSTSETPFLRLEPLTAERPVMVEGLTITPVALNHVVPTFGFIVANSTAAIAIVSDTSPSDRVWEIANATPQLKAVFLEVSFPENMRWLADKAMHLTPALFRDELGKLHRDVSVIAVHVKPAFRDAIITELQALAIPHVKLGEPGRGYEF